jgi:hypothetical protein
LALLDPYQQGNGSGEGFQKFCFNCTSEPGEIPEENFLYTKDLRQNHQLETGSLHCTPVCSGKKKSLINLKLLSSGLLRDEELQFLTDVSGQLVSDLGLENPKIYGSSASEDRIDCPEASVINYHYSPLNNPEESSCRLLHDGSLKTSIVIQSLFYTNLCSYIYYQ